MRQKPGNIISGVQFNVAAMDTGNPSILYDSRATDGNPFCDPPPPPPLQPEQYSWQIRLGTKNSCLGPVFVCFVSAF